MPWLLMTLSTIGALMVLWATVWWWSSFGTLGRVTAALTVLVAFGALAGLAIAFVTRILAPAWRMRRNNAF